MGQEDTSTDSASQSLCYLSRYFRERPVTGPDGHSYTSNEPRPTATHPGLPVNVRVLERIDQTVAEVVAYTREVNPQAEPFSDDSVNVYRWCVENTVHAPEAQQLRREVLEYRHSLEHAVAAGETDVIRPHRCPECRTFGLMWDGHTRQIRCTNRECVDDNGLGTVVDFARLAQEHVAGKRKLRQVSAT
ncbi:hypothetical protein [Streptomyces pilosus]|uniref:hypothetical protein n=1 Tax=Streptomyces pilosus TaxID=28893 RepID=UPI00362C90FD